MANRSFLAGLAAALAHVRAAAVQRHLPILVFVIVLAAGLAMTFVVYRAETMATQSRFEVIADDAADRVQRRVMEHIALLRSALSFFDAEVGHISKETFRTFVDGLQLDDQVSGIQGIGFARLIKRGEEREISAELEDNYGIDRGVWPDSSDQDRRTPIVMLQPDGERNQAALGYDMYSDPIRREAMKNSISVDGAFASAPVQLVQEITEDKQAGFLIYAPLHAPAREGEPGPVIGFVYAPFRAGDLHEAALERAARLPIVVRTEDIGSNQRAFLYSSPDFETVSAHSAFSVTRSFSVAGRQWEMTVASTPAFRVENPSLGILVLGAISFLLAAALAVSAAAQIHAVEAARRLHANTEKDLHEKDMMLREMKHRIKNSIARVLAIARQTASRSDSLDAFTASFTARLQAMSNAQDMLTRSHWQRTDLRELISVELGQVFGDDASACGLHGDPVELNEKATQSLGLVFHELATNALKYGCMAEEGGRLDITWTTQNRARERVLTIDWSETAMSPVQAPESNGFGTRLVNANIRSELQGKVDWRFEPAGLKVKLEIPKSSYA